MAHRLRGLGVRPDDRVALCVERGFDRVAIGPATPPDHGAQVRAWVEAGHAGTMGYLGRRLEERLDPGRVLPGAASVVCVALNYYQGEAPDPSWRPVARYAWGRDYHDVIKKLKESQIADDQVLDFYKHRLSQIEDIIRYAVWLYYRFTLS